MSAAFNQKDDAPEGVVAFRFPLPEATPATSWPDQYLSHMCILLCGFAISKKTLSKLA